MMHTNEPGAALMVRAPNEGHAKLRGRVRPNLSETASMSGLPSLVGFLPRNVCAAFLRGDAS